jgi:hypothetical protein
MEYQGVTTKETKNKKLEKLKIMEFRWFFLEFLLEVKVSSFEDLIKELNSNKIKPSKWGVQGNMDHYTAVHITGTFEGLETVVKMIGKTIGDCNRDKSEEQEYAFGMLNEILKVLNPEIKFSSNQSVKGACTSLKYLLNKKENEITRPNPKVKIKGKEI